MNKRDYCHRLADINEALYDNEKELKNVKFKLVAEDDPGKRAWFAIAQERLIQERDELKEKRTALEAEGYSDSE